MTQALDPSDLPDTLDALNDVITEILRDPVDDEALFVAIDCGFTPRTDYSTLEVNPDDTAKMFRLISGCPDEPEDEITKTQL